MGAIFGLPLVRTNVTNLRSLDALNLLVPELLEFLCAGAL
jgi:hypothetical protein